MSINCPNGEFTYAVIFAGWQMMMCPDNTKTVLTIFNGVLLTQFYI